ncbi:AraC family transcriptional regulator [Paenibacillus sp. TRM 82003]|nr:AraC family transcriptional regulator [Paenibacillus sp. TRM 82003]
MMHSKDYAVYRVMHYIDTHIQRKLSLGELAEAAAYSPYHFHRLFKATTGLAPNEYIYRMRMDQVVRYVTHFPHLTLTEIAEKTGFAALNDLSRAFKARFGRSATQFREELATNRKICIIDRNISQRYFTITEYNRVQEDGRPSIEPHRALKVAIKTLPRYRVRLFPIIEQPHDDRGLRERAAQAFRSHVAWKTGRHNDVYQSLLIGIARSDTRYDACITIPDDEPETENLPTASLSTGPYAMLRIAAEPDERRVVLQAFYEEWLSSNGYTLGDGPCLEIFGSTAAFQAGCPAYSDLYIPLELY